MITTILQPAGAANTLSFTLDNTAVGTQCIRSRIIDSALAAAIWEQTTETGIQMTASIAADASGATIVTRMSELMTGKLARASMAGENSAIDVIINNVASGLNNIKPAATTTSRRLLSMAPSRRLLQQSSPDAQAPVMRSSMLSGGN